MISAFGGVSVSQKTEICPPYLNPRFSISTLVRISSKIRFDHTDSTLEFYATLHLKERKLSQYKLFLKLDFKDWVESV